MNKDLRLKKIHFVGIKGVGMTPLAIIAKEAGINVTGSDVNEVFITDEPLKNAGIKSFTEFSPDHITDDINLVITTGAHGGFQNPEVLKAKEMNIPVLTQGEAVGVFMDGTILGRKTLGISVAGTHGKTTTTAMIATVLKKSKQDPSYVIGTSTIPSLGNAGHYGKGNYFVAEADEYATEPMSDRRAKFFWQHPNIAVITNIELDHPDIYENVSVMRNTFLQFAQQIPTEGVLVACGDDHEVRTLLKEYTGRVITYGFSPANDFIIEHTSFSAQSTFFRVKAYGTSLGEFFLHVSGEHNCLNALASIIVGFEVGLSLDVISKSLAEFKGTKRRLEFIRTLETGALLYDDYGHHPTEIQKTLAGLRSVYPKKKITCIFQPHTYSRTKVLFEEFSRAFQEADEVIIIDIYPSMREQPDSSVSSKLLVESIKKHHRSALFLPKLHDVVKYIDEKRPGEGTVVVTMGAGDIYKLNELMTI